MSQTKKILFYTDTPLFGGAEKQMLYLAKNLDTQKFQPIFICRLSENLQELYKELDQLKIPTFISKTRSKNSPSNLGALLKIIKLEKPDLIHAHIWNPVACKFAFLAAKMKKIPLVITEHDPFELSGPRKIYKKWSLKIPQKIITVSQANQNLLTELYPKFSNKFVTVHNGIETPPKHINDQRRSQIKKQIFQAGLETTIIFSAGTLHPRKGYKYLIGAFAKIADKFPNHKLIIAGEGPARDDLQKLINNLDLDKKVVLLGQRSDVLELMQASDLFVLPSIKEAFGLVIVEAMQAGLPIIASNVGGIPEIISSPELGILIKPADKNSLVKALSKMLSSKELRKKIGKNASAHWKHFSAEKMAKETENIYSQVLTTK